MTRVRTSRLPLDTKDHEWIFESNVEAVERSCDRHEGDDHVFEQIHELIPYGTHDCENTRDEEKFSCRENMLENRLYRRHSLNIKINRGRDRSDLLGNACQSTNSINLTWPHMEKISTRINQKRSCCWCEDEIKHNLCVSRQGDTIQDSSMRSTKVLLEGPVSIEKDQRTPTKRSRATRTTPLFIDRLKNNFQRTENFAPRVRGNRNWRPAFFAKYFGREGREDAKMSQQVPAGGSLSRSYVPEKPRVYSIGLQCGFGGLLERDYEEKYFRIDEFVRDLEDRLRASRKGIKISEIWHSFLNDDSSREECFSQSFSSESLCYNDCFIPFHVSSLEDYSKKKDAKSDYLLKSEEQDRPLNSGDCEMESTSADDHHYRDHHREQELQEHHRHRQDPETIKEPQDEYGEEFRNCRLERNLDQICKRKKSTKKAPGVKREKPRKLKRGDKRKKNECLDEEAVPSFRSNKCVLEKESISGEARTVSDGSLWDNFNVRRARREKKERKTLYSSLTGKGCRICAKEFSRFCSRDDISTDDEVERILSRSSEIRCGGRETLLVPVKVKRCQRCLMDLKIVNDRSYKMVETNLENLQDDSEHSSRHICPRSSVSRNDEDNSRNKFVSCGSEDSRDFDYYSTKSTAGSNYFDVNENDCLFTMENFTDDEFLQCQAGSELLENIENYFYPSPKSMSARYEGASKEDSNFDMRNNKTCDVNLWQDSKKQESKDYQNRMLVMKKTEDHILKDIKRRIDEDFDCSFLKSEVYEDFTMPPTNTFRTENSNQLNDKQIQSIDDTRSMPIIPRKLDTENFMKMNFNCPSLKSDFSLPSTDIFCIENNDQLNNKQIQCIDDTRSMPIIPMKLESGNLMKVNFEKQNFENHQTRPSQTSVFREFCSLMSLPLQLNSSETTYNVDSKSSTWNSTNNIQVFLTDSLTSSGLNSSSEKGSDTTLKDSSQYTVSESAGSSQGSKRSKKISRGQRDSSRPPSSQRSKKDIRKNSRSSKNLESNDSGVLTDCSSKDYSAPQKHSIKSKNISDASMKSYATRMKPAVKNRTLIAKETKKNATIPSQEPPKELPKHSDESCSDESLNRRVDVAVAKLTKNLILCERRVKAKMKLLEAEEKGPKRTRIKLKSSFKDHASVSLEDISSRNLSESSHAIEWSSEDEKLLTISTSPFSSSSESETERKRLKSPCQSPIL